MSLPAEKREDDGTIEARDLRLQAACDPGEMEEVELSSLLDLQNERQEKESKQSTRMIFRGCGFLLVAGLVWYAVSPKCRQEVDSLIQNVKEIRKDLDQVNHPGDSKSPYDRIMDKLGSRSVEIDTATRSLGVNPKTVNEDGMDAEMKGMMGGNGRTAGERERMVESLARAAGVELPNPTGRTTSPVAKTAVKTAAPADQAPAQDAPAR